MRQPSRVSFRAPLRYNSGRALKCRLRSPFGEMRMRIPPCQAFTSLVLAAALAAPTMAQIAGRSRTPTSPRSRPAECRQCTAGSANGAGAQHSSA